MTERFRILIYREALPAGSRLPSVRQLAMDLSINPNTIQRAYAQLETEGLIYSVKGKGNFVADTQQIKKKNREDYRRELMETVQKGKSLGFSEEELVSEVEHSYEEGEE